MTANPTSDVTAILQHGAKEGQVILSCVAAAWLDYAAALLRARGPGDVLDAGTKLAADGVDIFSRSAGWMQAYHGAIVPTLNDA